MSHKGVANDQATHPLAMLHVLGIESLATGVDRSGHD
jgi:hypothetical protein